METRERGAFETAVMGFWRHPDASAIIEMFAAEPVTGQWRAETVLTLPVFLAQVLDRSPETAARLVEAVRGGDAVKVEVVAQALNYSHHPERVRLMERLVGDRAAAAMDLDGADFTDFHPTHPVHVDMLWASFFATGQPIFVERIAALLEGWMLEPELQALLAVAGEDESVRERALGGVLANAALWSLTVNARDIAEIRASLQVFAARADGLAAAMTARILAGIT